MALSRRSGSRFQASIWPGFVDAMTALLLVLMFVLTVFMIVQFVLQETISNQDHELDELSVQISGLSEALGLEQQRNFQLETQVGELSSTLDAAEEQTAAQSALIASLQSQSATQADLISQQETRLATFEAQVASLMSERNAAVGRGNQLAASVQELEGIRNQLISEQEAMQLALARARDEIDAEAETARLAAAQADALQSLIAEMESEATAREQSLADLAAQLASADAAQSSLSEQLAAILGERDTLAAKLANARSEAADTRANLDATETERMQLIQRLVDITEDRDKTAADLEAARQAQAEMAKDLNSNRAIRETLAERLAQISDDRDSIAARLREAEDRGVSLEARLANALVEQSNLTNELGNAAQQEMELAAELFAAQAALSAETRARIEDGAQIQDLQSIVERLQLDVADQNTLRAARQELENRLTGALSQLDDEERRRLDQAELVQQLRNRLADLETELTNEEAARLTEMAALEKLRRELQEAQVSFSAAEAARLADAAALDRLRRDYANLETKVDEAEAARLRESLAATALRERLDGLAAALSDEEKKRLSEAAAAQALRERLANAGSELTAMTLALEEQRKRAEETLTLLAAAESVRADLEAKLSDALIRLAAQEAEARTLRATSGISENIGAELGKALAARLAAEQAAKTNLTLAEERDALLRVANQQLEVSQAATAQSQREVALLNAQVRELRKQLGSLQALLDVSEERDSSQQVELQALGSRLNAALARAASEQRRRAELEEAERQRLEIEARKLAEEAALSEEQVKELSEYRSEFFGELKRLLGDREGVEIVGDRFLFSSEVLFESASATLAPEGQEQIAQVVSLLEEVAGQIPAEIDWILRVDGHTDDRPLSGTGRYANNWELSQGRALSVVTFMIDELGFEPSRLAPTGFGEHRPVDPADTAQARARNRRIELKLTER